MSKLFSLLLVLCCLQLSAQGFQDFVNSLFATSPPLRQARVDSFINANSQYPLIEDDTAANFILTGNYNLVQLAGDMNGWDPTSAGFTAIKIPSTNFFFLSKYFEKNARLDYKFVTNGSNWILDPKNPHQVSGGFGPNSELAMPHYVQPWEIENYPAVPKGTIRFSTVNSTIMSSTYQVQVYLPPNYDSGSAYPVAYFHDGNEYISLGNANRVLDNLIDSNLIEPLIGVFVKPNDRNEEYGFSKRFMYRDFFCDELVPWVDMRYATIPDSSHRATIGASFGGNISALISLDRPEVFYKMGQHSGAWWPNNYEAESLLNNSNHKDIPMPSVWGSYEGSLTASWKDIADDLITGNYPNKYFNQYPEGHSWGLWRATLDELLIFLFPDSGVVHLSEHSRAGGWAVYPNPMRNTCYVAGSELRGKSFRVVDTAGKMVLEGKVGEESMLDLTDLPSGNYHLMIGDSEVQIVKR